MVPPQSLHFVRTPRADTPSCFCVRVLCPAGTLPESGQNQGPWCSVRHHCTSCAPNRPTGPLNSSLPASNTGQQCWPAQAREGRSEDAGEEYDSLQLSRGDQSSEVPRLSDPNLPPSLASSAFSGLGTERHPKDSRGQEVEKERVTSRERASVDTGMRGMATCVGFWGRAQSPAAVTQLSPGLTQVSTDEGGTQPPKAPGTARTPLGETETGTAGRRKPGTQAPGFPAVLSK